MKKGPVLALLSLCVIWGCATARVYPVKGPLSTRTPAPIYSAKMSGAFYSGEFSTVLSDGEKFKGHWERMARPTTGQGTSTASVLPAHNLSAEWDTVYGPGFYSNVVLNSQFYLRSSATGNHGTTLKVEMYRNETRPVIGTKGDENIVRVMQGVAKDDKGNIYKLTFQ